MTAIAAPAAAESALDDELVAAVRDGDDSAFEELYRRYHLRVFAFVQGRVRDEGRAEELTQEAFISALRRLRVTDSAVAFRPWIYEIARNATIDHHRRQSRTQEVSVEEAGGLGPADQLRLVGDVAPDTALVVKQQLEALRGAFAELSETHERILVLRELEGLSYREIGERMQLTRPGVESTLFRARRRLQREYDDLQTGRRCLTVRGAMARLAEGLALRGDHGKVGRHVRRCTNCRATAAELGIDVPLVTSRAAALLPLPAILWRRLGPSSPQTLEALGAKGAAVAAALVVAGGGAGIGGAILAERGVMGLRGDPSLGRVAPGAPSPAPAGASASPPSAHRAPLPSAGEARLAPFQRSLMPGPASGGQDRLSGAGAQLLRQLRGGGRGAGRVTPGADGSTAPLLADPAQDAGGVLDGLRGSVPTRAPGAPGPPAPPSSPEQPSAPDADAGDPQAPDPGVAANGTVSSASANGGLAAASVH
jgi:RNA polymerase sigma factor (sigma-70 family)